MHKKRSLAKEALGHLILCGGSFVISSLFTPYGQSLGQTLRETERLIEECPHDFSRSSPRGVSVALSRLKRRGLVTRKGPKKKAIWLITKAGRRHFQSVSSSNDFDLPPIDGKTRLVIFDVPEDRRDQRDWLRFRLSSCEYSPLQKSVWVGTRPLPHELQIELKQRRLNPYIHVVGLEEATHFRGV